MEAHAHVTPVSTYITVFVILLALTLLTIVTALMPMGVWHTPGAMGIAAVKATLVFLFFMHLLHSPRLIWLAAGGTVVWLLIMFVLTLADYYFRGVATRYL